MASSTKQKAKQKPVPRPPKGKAKQAARKDNSFLPWILAVVVITAICFWPMLKNNFTNWDDEFYVVKNALLRGPDWNGIFSQAVVSNYHPLTIITLAINYQLGGLDPTSYLWFNLVLHLANTALVFYFIWLISGRKLWPSVLVALIFGIHPLHVESVAWVSERKDVLYTFFFFLSLIQYWNYLQTNKSSKLWLSFGLFVLSLLSKPAAIILPLVLLLLDYWKGRQFSQKMFTEKILFFALALLFAIVTVQIQSEKAIAGLGLYPLWTRPLFGCYVVMIYFLRFFFPHPLSAFHPYPPVENLGWAVYASPLFILALAVLLWWRRKDKLLVFGFLFFIVNLLLVMQVVSIGTTIVSERYTYVPYVGLAFMLGMLLARLKKPQPAFLALSAIIAAVFGYITFQRVHVWKDSETLWTDVIRQYPNVPIPLTNRAEYLVALANDPANAADKDSLLQRALRDCNEAIRLSPKNEKAYEHRGVIYLTLNRNQEALTDGNFLRSIAPENLYGYTVPGTAHIKMNEPEKALEDFSKAISISPNDDFSRNKRGSLLSSFFKKYNDALVDFNKAIEVNPLPDYYLNRSYCYFMLGDLTHAKADAQTAMEKGKVVDANYRKQVGL